MIDPTTETGQCPKCNQPWKRTVETIAGNVYRTYQTHCTCSGVEEIDPQVVADCTPLNIVKWSKHSEPERPANLQVLTPEEVVRLLAKHQAAFDKMQAELKLLRELVKDPANTEARCTWCDESLFRLDDSEHHETCEWKKWKETYGR